MEPSLRIGFVALNAFPAVFPGTQRRIGGMETFAWNFCRELARSAAAGSGAMEIGLCLRHTWAPRSKVVDGVRLHVFVEPLRDIRASVAAATKPIESFPGFQIAAWNPRLLWQIPLLLGIKGLRKMGALRGYDLEAWLGSLDGDCLVALGVSQESAAALRAARQQRKLGVLWIRSNGDIDLNLVNDPSFRNAYGVTGKHFRDCFQHANLILCQSAEQRDLILERTGQAAVVIPNPVDRRKWDSVEIDQLKTSSRANEPAHGDVLWIGRFDRMHKRPALLVELARLLPKISFTMVANQWDTNVQREILSDLPRNIRWVEFVQPDQMPRLLCRSGILVSTGSSEHEGFPNIFLEAAAAGVPIASLEDFGDFLKQSRAGVSTQGDMARLAEQILSLHQDPERRQALGANGKMYVSKHHDPATIAEKFLSTISHARESSNSLIQPPKLDR